MKTVWYSLLFLGFASYCISIDFPSSHNPYLRPYVRQYEERDQQQQDSGQDPKLLREAEEYLDEKIAELLEELPETIDHAIEKVEHSLQVKIMKRTIQGWAVVFGHLKEVYSEYVTYNRSLGNMGQMTTLYEYCRLSFYGVGFGFPILLGLPDSKLDCGSKDFKEVLDEYYLTNGLDFLLSQGLPIEAVSSIVGEFDIMLRLRLECILEFALEKKDVAFVLFGLDELSAAINLRINIAQFEEEADQEAGNPQNALKRIAHKTGHFKNRLNVLHSETSENDDENKNQDFSTNQKNDYHQRLNEVGFYSDENWSDKLPPGYVQSDFILKKV